MLTAIEKGYNMYFTYILKCTDNTLYTGICTDVERRMKEHFSKDKKCAKYTKFHAAEKLMAVWESENRVLASKLEFRIKQLTRKEKDELIKINNLQELLGEKIDTNNYKRIECVNMLNY